MLRIISCFGLGGFFLLISPPLRQSVVDTFHSLEVGVIDNSPWSYVGIGVGVLALMMFCLHQAAKPRI